MAFVYTVDELMLPAGVFVGAQYQQINTVFQYLVNESNSYSVNGANLHTKLVGVTLTDVISSPHHSFLA